MSRLPEVTTRQTDGRQCARSFPDPSVDLAVAAIELCVETKIVWAWGRNRA